jgi:cytochrome c553
MAGTLKVGGLVLVGTGLAVILAALGLYLSTQYRLADGASVPTDHITIPTDISNLQEGQHIAGAIALCAQCHGPNLGGAVVFDSRSARVVAPDLTRGGIGATFSDADYVRAIRYGIDPSGRRLWLMPTDAYNQMSDADLGALIAYLKSLPPTGSSLPPSLLRPVGRVLFGIGQLNLLPAEGDNWPAPRPTPVPIDVTPAYGQYLVNIAGCARCHAAALSGGPAPDLTPSGRLGTWSQADFLRAMRTGHRPDGSDIDTSMPWPYYAQMTDLELESIWAYLSVLPRR